MTWIGVLTAFWITARMTRLIAVDALTAPFRRYVDERWGEASKPAVLIHCSWCTGFWIALGVALASHWLDDAWGWQVFATACGANWVYAVAASWLDDE